MTDAAQQLYRSRVTIERANLHGNIERLAKFLDTETYYLLPKEEQKRLVRQLHIMNDYREVLDERIAAFPAV